MKILIVDTYYFQFLERAVLTKPKVPVIPYERLITDTESLGFGTGAAYCHYLRELGWEAHLVIPNSYSLQNTWIEENLGGDNLIPLGWRHLLQLARILPGRSPMWFRHAHWALVQQARLMQPDVIYVQDINFPTPFVLKQLKKYSRLVVGEIASPLPPSRFVRNYDLLVSALPSVLDAAERMGVRTKYLPLGFDHRNKDLRENLNKDIDVLFVGSFYKNQPDTIKMLSLAKEKIPGLRIYGPATQRQLKKFGLSQNYFGQAWGGEMFDLIRRAKIVLNRHGAAAGDFAVNMRMYEVTGMGSLLITEAKSNITDLFTPGREVVTYSTPEEAVDRAIEYLSDDESRNGLARQGQIRTLNDHTYQNRVAQLSEELLRVLND